MTDVTAQLLTQLIWHQISVAFSWNRGPRGDIVFLNEPVTEAFLRVVAGLLSQQANPPQALEDFITRLREALASPAQVGVTPEIRAMIDRVLKNNS